MATPKKLSKKQATNLRADYVRGATYTTLADKYDCSTFLVRSVVLGIGAYSGFTPLTPRAAGFGRTNPVSDLKAYTVLAERVLGRTQAEAAEKAGVSASVAGVIDRRERRFASLLTESDVNKARTAFYRDGTDLRTFVAMANGAAQSYVNALPYRTRGWTKTQTEEAIADYVQRNGEGDLARMFPDYYGTEPAPEPAPIVGTVEANLVDQYMDLLDRYKETLSDLAAADQRIAILEADLAPSREATRRLERVGTLLGAADLLRDLYGAEAHTGDIEAAVRRVLVD